MSNPKADELLRQLKELQQNNQLTAEQQTQLNQVLDLQRAGVEQSEEVELESFNHSLQIKAENNQHKLEERADTVADVATEGLIDTANTSKGKEAASMLEIKKLLEGKATTSKPGFAALGEKVAKLMAGSRLSLKNGPSMAKSFLEEEGVNSNQKIPKPSPFPETS